jgi:hypothetical protein
MEIAMKWEYKTIRFDKKRFFSSALDIEWIELILKKNGIQGWELVHFSVNTTFIGIEISALAILKKQVKESA